MKQTNQKPQRDNFYDEPQEWAIASGMQKQIILTNYKDVSKERLKTKLKLLETIIKKELEK